MGTELIIVLVVCTVLALVAIGATIIISIKSTKANKDMINSLIEYEKNKPITFREPIFEKEVKPEQQSVVLTYDEVNKIIDDRIVELWTYKYYPYYRLREIKIIPELDKQIDSFVNDVMDSFSAPILKSIYIYYTKHHFIGMITRRAQGLMMEYLQTYKPATRP